MAAKTSIHVGEGAANHDSAVRFKQDGPHRRVDAQARIERGIEASIGKQPDKVRASQTIERDEITANENFAVILQGKGVDGAIESRPDTEVRVDCAIGIEKHETRRTASVEQAEG